MELEKKLGKKLLIREKKKITLTEEVMGDIYVGGSISESVLAVATELRYTYPGIHFHFYSGDAVDVSERLNPGSLDFAVMLEPIDNIKYDFLSLPDCSEWGILMKKVIPWQ